MSHRWNRHFLGRHRDALIKPFMHIKRVRQIDDSYCGPAVLEMLLSHLRVHATQVELGAAIEADRFIQSRGTRVDELATAINKTFPHIRLWYKEHATKEELAFLVNQMKYPVGVEWQGLFYNSVEEEAASQGQSDDAGHYSVVKNIDVENDAITLADPYKDFCDEDRVFPLSWFESRWWDVNEVMMNSYPKYIRDEQMMFILTLNGTYFPKLIGMKLFGK